MGRYAPWALSLLRIVTALVFLEHGSGKLLGFPKLPTVPALTSLPGIGGVLELVGGILLLFGLFTRPVAFLLAGEMAVAYWTVHAPRSHFPVLNGGDSAIQYCFVFLYFIFAGAGPLSLDRVLRRAA